MFTTTPLLLFQRNDELLKSKLELRQRELAKREARVASHTVTPSVAKEHKDEDLKEDRSLCSCSSRVNGEADGEEDDKKSSGEGKEEDQKVTSSLFSLQL